jgi:hypothetical protein
MISILAEIDIRAVFLERIQVDTEMFRQVFKGKGELGVQVLLLVQPCQSLIQLSEVLKEQVVVHRFDWLKALTPTGLLSDFELHEEG